MAIGAGVFKALSDNLTTGIQEGVNFFERKGIMDTNLQNVEMAKAAFDSFKTKFPKTKLTDPVTFTERANTPQEKALLVQRWWQDMVKETEAMDQKVLTKSMLDDLGKWMQQDPKTLEAGNFIGNISEDATLDQASKLLLMGKRSQPKEFAPRRPSTRADPRLSQLKNITNKISTLSSKKKTELRERTLKGLIKKHTTLSKELGQEPVFEELLEEESGSIFGMKGLKKGVDLLSKGGLALTSLVSSPKKKKLSPEERRKQVKEKLKVSLGL